LKDFDVRSAKYWMLLAPVLLVALFFLIYPYHKGLFHSPVAVVFEGPLYGAMIWLSVTFAVWALLYPFRTASEGLPVMGTGNARAEGSGGHGRKNLSFMLARHPYLRQYAPFAVFLLPLSYFVSLWNAASPHSATITFMIWVVHAFVFLMAYDAAREPTARIIFAAAIGLSGTAIVIFGFMNYFGDASLWGMIQYTGRGGPSNTYHLAVEYGASGLRLTSVFQYANSYAAFLIGFFLLLMAAVTHARKSWVAALAALPIVPALLAFLLTQSRGGYLMLPIASLLFLALIRTHRQLVFLALSVLAGILAILLYNPVFNLGLKAAEQGFDPSLPLRGWALLIPVSAGFAAVAVLIHRFGTSRLERFVERRIRFRGRQLLLPLAGLVLGAAGAALLLRSAGLLRWLPEALRTRLETINLAQHSVLERWTFYKDIFKMIRDYPWLGAGGHSWATLYYRYQNNPYTSNDPHSFYLQYLLDTGIIGFTLFIAFLAICLAVALKKAFRLQFQWDAATLACFSIPLGLAVHSAIDLDMNYLYHGVLFFLGLGVLAAPIPAGQANEDPSSDPAAAEPAIDGRDRPKISGGKNARASRRKRAKIYSPAAVRARRISYGVAAVCIAGALTMTVVASQRLASHSIYFNALMEADRTSVDIEYLDDQIREALKNVPKHPFYLAQRSNLMLQVYESTGDPHFLREAASSFEPLAAAEPNRKDVIMLRIRLLLAQGDRENALEAAESGLAMFPWDMTLYEQVFALHYALGSEAAQRGDEDTRRSHWEAILRWHDVIQARIEHLATLPKGQTQGKPFEMSKGMKNILAKVQNEV